MRKSIPKLVLRKESVRMLAAVDLSPVQGGSNTAAQVAAESNPKQCGPTTAVLAAPGS